MTDSALTAPPPALSPTRAFLALVGLSFQRHWRVRQMGFVALGLVLLAATAVAVVTASRAGWGLSERKFRRGSPTQRQAAALPLTDAALLAPVAPDRPPRAVDPLGSSLALLVAGIPPAVLNSPAFIDGWSMATFSRWVVVGLYVGFVLPLFTLAYATAAFGSERENRSLVWAMTRPLPRSAIYLAKFLGTLPWCLVFSLGGFFAVCLAGGELGRRAAAMYWPAAVAGTVAFSAVFHLIGALFRRPVVVGMVYVFFFEGLVSALPGSLKMLSLSYYTRSLIYNEAHAAGLPVGLLDVVGPTTGPAAWAVLAAAAGGVTLLGMGLFARAEYRDDV